MTCIIIALAPSKDMRGVQKAPDSPICKRLAMKMLKTYVKMDERDSSYIIIK